MKFEFLWTHNKVESAIRIRAILIAQHWSQQGLADTLGCSNTVVCHWATGRNLPSSEFHPKLLSLEKEGQVQNNSDLF